MLERIHVENYKCLRDVTVDLGDFTVLIGPNDSGKSSFLDVLQTFGNLVEKDQSGTFVGDHSLPNLVWHKDAAKQIVLGVSGKASDQRRFEYCLKLAMDGRSHEVFESNGERDFWTEEASQDDQHRAFARGTVSTAVRTGQGKEVLPQQPGRLYLHQFLTQRRPGAADIRQALSSSVEYHFDPEKLSSASAQLLLIEEPENGLHPTRLQMVVEILRKMSRGEIGNRKRQIVVTTHNPLLLNYVHPDEVRVFVRHPDDGTKIVPMTQVPDIDRLLKEFSLGELWYLLGEEKLFQEQRT